MTTVTATASHRGMSGKALIPIALMLFSMFFGAGNLIFPPVLGANAGVNFTPAVIGFLLGGVALPVITMITVALSGHDVRALVARGGTIFAIGFSVAVYLSIGAFFAIPRTGAVSFSTAISPITGWDSTTASVGFNLVFFGICFALSLNPSGLVDKLGKILTPALLALLAVLVVLSIFTLHSPKPAPTEAYATTPLVAGLFEGYMTMDSIASLAFGILVISAIRNSKKTENFPIIKGTTIAAIIAGALLGIIYLGLALMGLRITNGQGFSDGAALLSAASLETLGTPGQVLFGGIVLLACLTTAVGLLAATSEFFNQLIPAVSYKVWLTVFVVISFIIASAGLGTVLKIAVPIIIFLYPIAITVVIITLIGFVWRTPIFLGFRLAVWTVTVWSLITTIAPEALSWALWQEHNFGWVIPMVIALAVGMVVDLKDKEQAATNCYNCLAYSRAAKDKAEL
ncbi:branched-chain amino acid transport system II carrier protein [Corynebacterium felinum]|uniref:LIVCS family branched-chain amino acid:cation transporter n=1 Tax=Corynebacterium felinum TaxID=131318 RepID=A0ABU2B4H2_9CORY|nr:branched-chain amino acid transport system II carrier protein [Corynebacterium felinum]MDF5821410.1 branched-chain amino acid transport system II carrier protein [Corynebacterium felinum]MDR7353500.1 LIVCS family branched-chain amino acid:cation transporter [Corynebacterium felinum]WJY95679.1 Branched-chain amino acid transport system 2 carrier protein [Corynebacterium felinum]